MRPRKVTDQKHDPVAQILEVLHLANNHRMAEVNVRRSGVETGFDRQRCACLPGPPQSIGKLFLAYDLDRPLAQIGHLFFDRQRFEVFVHRNFVSQ